MSEILVTALDRDALCILHALVIGASVWLVFQCCSVGAALWEVMREKLFPRICGRRLRVAPSAAEIPEHKKNE